MNDETKKYIDYPWCAYADANPSLYTTYGYAEDLLAKHWDSTGAKKGLALGGIINTTICTKETEHTLQEICRPRKITCKSYKYDDITGVNDSNNSCLVYDSKGNQIYAHANNGTVTWTLYPGYKVRFLLRWEPPLFGSGSASRTWVKINGKQVATGRGQYDYVVPNDISAMDITIFINVRDDLSADSQFTVTTTKFAP